MTLKLNQINGEQVKLMKHALGLNREKEPYRNYYNCSPDNKDWNDLVNKGFAVKRGGWSEDDAYYHVTDEAIDLIKRI